MKCLNSNGIPIIHSNLLPPGAIGGGLKTSLFSLHFDLLPQGQRAGKYGIDDQNYKDRSIAPGVKDRSLRYMFQAIEVGQSTDAKCGQDTETFVCRGWPHFKWDHTCKHCLGLVQFAKDNEVELKPNEPDSVERGKSATGKCSFTKEPIETKCVKEGFKLKSECKGGCALFI